MPNQLQKIGSVPLYQGAATKLILAPEKPLSPVLTKTGSPTITPTSKGLGYTFGSGNYYNTPTGFITDSNGSGNLASACYSITCSFVLSSIATNEAIFSTGSTATDSNPLLLLKLLSGQIQLYDSAAYRVLDTNPMVGKIYTVKVTYSDFTPYTLTVSINGIIVWSNTGYRTGISTHQVYIGSGYSTQSVNSKILLFQIETGGQTNLTTQYANSITYDPRQLFFSSKLPNVILSASSIAAVIATTDAGDSITFSGTETDSGTIAPTDASDSISLSGTETDLAILSTTDAGDSIAIASGDTASISTTDAPDSIAASGTETDSGTLSTTDASDSAAINANAGGDNAAIVTTDASDSISVTGLQSDGAAIVTTDANDTTAATATLTDSGTIAPTDVNDSIALTGAETDSGTISTTDGTDSISIGSGNTGALSTTDANDSAAITGTESNNVVIATTDATDSISMSGTQTGGGASIVTNDLPDTMSLTSAEVAALGINTQDLNDSIAITGFEKDSGAISTIDAPDTMLIAPSGSGGIATLDASDSIAITVGVNNRILITTKDSDDSGSIFLDENSSATAGYLYPIFNQNII